MSQKREPCPECGQRVVLPGTSEADARAGRNVESHICGDPKRIAHFFEQLKAGAFSDDDVADALPYLPSNRELREAGIPTDTTELFVMPVTTKEIPK